MDRYLYIIMSVLLGLQATAARGAHTYRLWLDGKPESKPCVLSVRAEERRERLGIEGDERDLEVSPLYLRQIAEQGLRVVTQSRWLNTLVVMSQDGTAVDDSLWQTMPFVTQVKHLSSTQRISAPQRPDVSEEAMDGGSIVATSAIDCTTPLRQVNGYDPLYKAGYRGEGMLIAVMDGGFGHIDEWEWLNRQVTGGRDLYETLSGESKLYDKDVMHGSCCLSVLVSPRDHGVCGTAQEALYYLIKSENNDSETELEEDMWVAGAELADSLGCDVISSSLGYGYFDNELEWHSPDDFGQDIVTISQGARIASEKGMLVVNAAGNEGNKVWRRLIFPADVEEVLTVGGINAKGDAVKFTSRGFTTPYVKPDVAARATDCYTVSAKGKVDRYGAGTSYATPLIAGLCASLWSAAPQLTPKQLREAVRQSASQWTAPDSITGYGIPDFDVALQLVLEWTGALGIEKTNADAPERDIDTRYYNLMGQPLKGQPREGLYLRRSRRQTGKSFQQR